MKLLYKITNSLRRIYWYIFRPKTQGVKCLIECNGEYLLIQTSYSGKYWTLPGGGIKRSETLEQAVKREVKEEVGINLENVKEVGSYESTAEYKKDTIYLFYAPVPTKEFQRNEVEVSMVAWFSKVCLPESQSRALTESLAILKS